MKDGAITVEFCRDWLTLARQPAVRTHCYSISLLILVLYEIRVSSPLPELNLFLLSSFRGEDVALATQVRQTK